MLRRNQEKRRERKKREKRGGRERTEGPRELKEKKSRKREEVQDDRQELFGGKGNFGTIERKQCILNSSNI